MKTSKTYLVSDEFEGKRLDVFLCHALEDLSRRRISEIIQQGLVRVSGYRRRGKAYQLKEGQEVIIEDLPPPSPAAPDHDVMLEIIYLDDDLVAVNKPSGRHCAAVRPTDSGTMAQGLLARFPEMKGVGFSSREPGICHRLDFQTSGVLLAARTQEAFVAVRKAFDEGRVRKEYLALVYGSPPDRFTVDEPISHPSRRSAHVLVGAKRGRGAVPARTEFETLRRDGKLAWVRARCATGAMHQVRAHAAYAGFPLVKDPVYQKTGAGKKMAKSTRRKIADGSAFFLHAAMMELPHPRTGELLRIEYPPPEGFF